MSEQNKKDKKQDLQEESKPRSPLKIIVMGILAFLCVILLGIGSCFGVLFISRFL